MRMYNQLAATLLCAGARRAESSPWLPYVTAAQPLPARTVQRAGHQDDNVGGAHGQASIARRDDLYATAGMNEIPRSSIVKLVVHVEALSPLASFHHLKFLEGSSTL